MKDFNTVYVTNGKESFKIPKDSLIDFLNKNSNFSVGRKFNNPSSKTWVNNGITSTYVKNEELEEFLLNNPDWKKGMAPFKKIKRKKPLKGSTLGKKWVNKNGIRKNISPEEIDTYLKNGWTLGSGNKPNKDRIRLHKGTINVLVKKEDIDTYLMNGYEYGISDNYKEACQKAWDSGKRSRHIPEEQRVALSQYKKGSRWMIKDNHKQQIPQDKISQALNDGWTFIYDKSLNSNS